jgi:hypothetical protein
MSLKSFFAKSGTNSVAVAVPIYKDSLSALEQFSLDQTFYILKDRETMFVCPDGLGITYYRRRYPAAKYVYFDKGYFASVYDYSRLLLSKPFYAAFSNFEFLLIVQPDVYVFRDDLDYWITQPFDYIGAPWPQGMQLNIMLGRYVPVGGKVVTSYVGNGGFSLRRVRKCIGLIDEFPDVIDTFVKSGSNEDLFYSIFGQLSTSFILPNQITASKFAIEIEPEHYQAITGELSPMGVHAFDKYAPNFWRSRIGDWPAPIS